MLKVSKKDSFAFFSLLLLSAMMVFQSQLYVIKVVLVLIVLMHIVRERVILSIPFSVFIISYLLYGLWGLLVGILNLNPNPFSKITVSFFWPLLFGCIITQIKIDRHYFMLLKVMFYVHFGIVIYDLLFICGTIVGFYVPNIYPSVETGFIFNNNSSRLDFTNLNILTFTMPVFYFLFITGCKFGVGAMKQFVLIVLTMFLFLISGRRSVMLLFIALPFISYFMKFILPKEIGKRISSFAKILIVFFVLVIAAIGFLYPETLLFYADVFFKAFDSDREPIKFIQQEMLVEAFMEKPFCGYGFGHMFYEPNIGGRGIFAYEYELQYHLKLAQTGIIGFSLLIFSYFGTLFYGLYLAWKKKDIVFQAFLLGYFCILIIDGTNPILNSFDLMMPLFLCWAKINTSSLQEKCGANKCYL